MNRSISATWIAFDTETTGIHPGSRLIELAAIAFADDGTILDTYTSLVNPGMPLPASAEGVNGITNADLVGKPDTRTVLANFLSWLPPDAILLGHNAPFDCGILTWECQRAGLPVPSCEVIDTCAMARAIGATRHCSLQALIAHYGIVSDGDAHRAYPDADAVRRYFHIARHLIEPVTKRWSSRYVYTDQLPAVLERLPEWVAKGQTIRLRYCNRQGRETTPTVIPHGWAKTDSGIWMHGWCDWAGDVCRFDVERVDEAAPECAASHKPWQIPQIGLTTNV